MGSELAGQLLAVNPSANNWVNTPVEGMKNQVNPWSSQKRASSDGDKESLFLSSLPKGEQLTGRLRSQIFAIPAQLQFFMAGHDGFPDKAPQKKNMLQLRLAGRDETVATAYPPRNDMAQPVKWDLKAMGKSDAIGQKGYLEIVDADDAGAYAWLAVGRFSPAVVAVPADEPGLVAKRQTEAAELARTLPAPQLELPLQKMISNPNTAREARLAGARALVSFHPNEKLGAVAEVLGDAATPEPLQAAIIQSLAGNASDTLLAEAMKTLPRRLQLKVAQSLAGSTAGSDELLKLVSAGQAPAALLQERTVKDKLTATKPENAKRIQELTRNLSSASEELQS